MDRRVFIQGLVATSTALVAGEAAAKPARAGVSAAGIGTAEPPATATESGCAPAVRSVGPGEASAHENLWPLLAPLAPGDTIGLGWRIVELSAVSSGAAILTLASDGLTERVHLCRFDGVARGVAHSESIDLVLMNRAGGALPTDENLARVLNVLALLMRSNERSGAAAPDGLIGHDARLAFFRAKRALL